MSSMLRTTYGPFFGTFKFSSELRDRVIQETGLPISFGLSINKTVSKVATGEAKPNNKIYVEKGLERPFLRLCLYVRFQW